MMGVKIFCYDKCGTCRSAIKWLKNHHVDITESVPLFETPPSAKELAKLLGDSGLEIKKFFNTSGDVYKEMSLKDKLSSMSQEQMLELLASNGRLIKRPIVTDGHKVTVGFKEAEYDEVWAKG
ncbi:arsenate reductase family protein [Paenibacillus alginolyticus]|uniref:Arsenate reductase family protein n=2 Tax=Paenibacillus alginolyticus TaxID=59839 RepID=A0ABT4G966_9BACL|nr:arsenate reductase family protein [Paenibacillus alginolyticus]MCY9666095.1 arsenate reductase family protein [Paenibacillus alginolyticus]MCY9692730.1 arsenate reductase family protein [Paenibacillus alginolyticus]MEC0146387.1 arsenate reductase family protein [Paenibacillus alginolyticus]